MTPRGVPDILFGLESLCFCDPRTTPSVSKSSEGDRVVIFWLLVTVLLSVLPCTFYSTKVVGKNAGMGWLMHCMKILHLK